MDGNDSLRPGKRARGGERIARNKLGARAEAFRSALLSLKMKLAADLECAADTLTAAYYPDGIEDLAFRNGMRQCGIVVAGILGPVKGKDFRIGHMVNVSQNDIISTIGSIEVTLKRLNCSFNAGAGCRGSTETRLTSIMFWRANVHKHALVLQRLQHTFVVVCGRI